MDKQMERYIITALVIILLGLGLSGCGVKTIKVEQPENKTPTTMETIGKLDAIGFVLGCMFDPGPCQKKRELAEAEGNK
tara:strand:+ start:404 stop:640 length:237 start_codon:yes stop_codon:yes gene_type:complete